MEVRTERLHYTQFPSYGGRGKVLEATETSIVTDVTVFHPEAGGQPCDHGTINGIEVISVEEQGEKVIHKFQSPHGINVGDEVVMVIDEVRRRDHAQQHTGQHILSRVCEDMFEAATGSFHMPEHGAASGMCTIDLSVKLTPSQLAEAEKKANEIVQMDVCVNSILCQDEGTLKPYREEARSFPKNLMASPLTPVRIINIVGFDSNPCCGTHVPTTGQIGVIKIFKQETSRGGVRVSFMCGMRCIFMMQKFVDSLNNVGSLLSTGPCDAAQACAKVKEELRVEKRTVVSLTELLLDTELVKLEEMVKTSTKYLIFVVSEAIPTTSKELKVLFAKLQTKCEHPLLLLGSSDGNATLFLVYNGTLVDINKVVAKIKETLSCKGGGAKGMYTFQLQLGGSMKTLDAVKLKLEELWEEI